MKKTVILSALAAMLAGCTGTPGGEAAAPETPAPAEAPAAAETSAAVTLDELPLSRAYIDAMEGYEDIEIVLLGCEDASRTIGDIFSRARNEWGFTLLDEIDQDHLVYGEGSDNGNYVYLLIPAEGHKVTIASYSPEKRGPGQVWYESENSLPVVYVESAVGMTPKGVIIYETGFADTVEEIPVYTGVDPAGVLRTAYRMGLVDKTPYDEMNSAEIGFLAQFLFDVLYNEAPSASSQLQEGTYRASAMEEMLYQGEMYMVYSLYAQQEGLEDYLYGIAYDTETNTLKYLESFDYQNWYDPAQAAG